MRRYDNDDDAYAALTSAVTEAVRCRSRVLLLTRNDDSHGWEVAGVRFEGDQIIPAFKHVLCMIDETTVPPKVLVHLKRSIEELDNAMDQIQRTIDKIAGS